MMIMTMEERSAYLKRLGIREIQAPTRTFLFELHKAHVNKLSWQTIDIFAGQPASMDVRESIQLMIGGRSGYCFQLNGAFCALLRSLGYRVSMHRAGVQPLGEAPRVNSFHLGLTVSMAGESNEEDETWIVDAGLGDMPYEPIPLRMGEYEQSPYTYKVVESGVVRDGWRLEHDPFASFAGVDFAPGIVQDISEFNSKHEYYSQSAESPWTQLLLVRHRHEQGSNELRGCIWSKRDRSGIEKTEIRTKSDWFALLGDVFGERLVRYSRQERDELWQKVKRKHEEWKRSNL
ncbi:arylamine N-acetyltransferase [Cohnella faecalis]|uniref:Arylamine N-acetyltransferase n=1 Tax=Cohnella faecalis TaxID=2315694 RepID=A0A398CF16_9BACL|nr:arylamine N-acetyltransferase [Cohnella faecalis]RIE01786.1 arylamine N-acetyltransferase [Cohnella faecalis]